MTDKNLKIYDYQSGKYLQTFYTKNDPNLDVSFSNDGSRILVTDVNGVILFLDKQGDVLHSFKYPELLSPYGICIGQNDAVFACGLGSGSVVQFTLDGQHLGTLLKKTDGLKTPISMCFDARRSRLILTERESDMVKVFTLK